MEGIAGRVRTGVSWGLYYALVFAGFATILVLVNGAALLEQYHLTYVQLVSSYLIGGAAGGFLVGLLLPLCRHPAGAMVAGFIGALPYSFLMTFLLAAPNEWSRLIPAVPLVVATCLGAGGGLAVWTVLQKHRI